MNFTYAQELRLTADTLVNIYTVGGTNYWTLSTDQLYNNSGTYVGIGTDAPNKALVVGSASNPSDMSVVINQSPSAFEIYSFSDDIDVINVDADDKRIQLNPSDNNSWRTVFNGTGGDYPVTIRGTGSNPLYGKIQFGIQSNDTEVGTGIDNTGSGGRSYNWFVTNDGTGAPSGGGCFSINDATVAEQRLIIFADGSIRTPVYGMGDFQGTPTWATGWDASGNLVEFPASAGGNCLMVDTGYNIYLSCIDTPLLTSAGNLMLGYRAGQNHTNGDYNVFLGYESGMNDGGPSYPANNIGIGYRALYNNAGAYNIGIGDGTIFNMSSSGGSNIAIGGSALNSAIAGNGNVAVGLQAMQNILEGDYNIAIGTNAISALDEDSTYSARIGIGYQSFVHGNNAIAIGINSSVEGDNGVAVGNNAVAIHNEFSLSDSIEHIHALLGGTYGAGKVLTSDSTGKANWQSPDSLLPYYEFTALLYQNGGTDTPVVKVIYNSLGCNVLTTRTGAGIYKFIPECFDFPQDKTIAEITPTAPNSNAKVYAFVPSTLTGTTGYVSVWTEINNDEEADGNLYASSFTIKVYK